MSVCYECSTLSGMMSPRLVDHSSRELLPSVMSLSVIEEPHSIDLGAQGPVELQKRITTVVRCQ